MRGVFTSGSVARIIAVVSLSAIMSAVLVLPPPGATQDGYGFASKDAWHKASLVEGRAAGTGDVDL